MRHKRGKGLSCPPLHRSPFKPTALFTILSPSFRAGRHFSRPAPPLTNLREFTPVAGRNTPRKCRLERLLTSVGPSVATVSGNEVEKTDEGYVGVIRDPSSDDKFFFSILSPFFHPSPFFRSNFARVCSRDCTSRWFIFERGVGRRELGRREEES